MNEVLQENIIPFSEDYWKQDGGKKWVELIDETEATLQVFNERLLEHAGITAGETVLDVGCGGGVNSIEIANRVGKAGRVVGVDISAEVLAVAEARSGHVDNLEFTEGDAASMPFDPDNFSLIFSRFGVMFFSDPVSAFANLRSSLKTEGRLVFLCWRSMEENTWMMEPARAVHEIIPPQGPPPDPDAPGPFSLGKSERVVGLLGAAGFQSIDIAAMDVGMRIGPLSNAVDFFMRMGPAAVAAADATEEQTSAIRNVLADVLKRHDTDDGVVMPGAAWLVTAR